MRSSEVATRAAAGAAIGVLALATAVPALAGPASVPGWRLAYGSGRVYTSVLATGRHEAWAFGFTGPNGGPWQKGTISAVHWTRGKWQPTPLPPTVRNMIFAISASSAGNVWAVANFGGYVLRWNGSRWSVAKHVTGGTTGLSAFSGITAIDRKDVWVFGGGGGAGIPAGLGTYHFDGSRWHQDAAATADMLQVASAASASDIWALGGFSQATAIYHFNGKWSRVHASALAGLAFNDVATAPGLVWVTAEAGHTATAKSWLLRLRKGRWAKMQLPWPVQLLADVRPDGSGGAWMTAYSGTGSSFKLWLIHRTMSGRWLRIQAPSATITRFPGDSAFLAASSNGLWAHGRI